MTTMVKLRNVGKSFTLHVQGSVNIPVFENLDLEVAAGECVALLGPSGAGKSSLMRMIYANYTCPAGEILVRHSDNWVDMAAGDAHLILDVRRQTLGYVSQFLRVIPRVSSLNVVMEPLLTTGVSEADANVQAQAILQRLNIPRRLWSLSPMTFSGGEQQRVNLARGFVQQRPIMLLDEPTASLDPENRRVVLDLINEARANGAAIIGIFHDADARRQLSSREFDTTQFTQVAA
jgi:alpha-D-ribose 1-methylphosphonate 5-triphosphate synthase subunit PhnL